MDYEQIEKDACDACEEVFGKLWKKKRAQILPEFKLYLLDLEQLAKILINKEIEEQHRHQLIFSRTRLINAILKAGDLSLQKTLLLISKLLKIVSMAIFNHYGIPLPL